MFLIANIIPQVYDYLVESAASNQTRESINEFMEKSKKYDLAKAEILNIINIRPASLVEIDPVMFLPLLLVAYHYLIIYYF